MVFRDYKIYCYCFIGDFKLVKLWLDYFFNLYIGLIFFVIYRIVIGVRDVVKFILLRRLLLESDVFYFVFKIVSVF